MAKEKPKYVAAVGIDFEQFKPPIRVEAGEPVPAGLDANQIEDLLDQGLIREREAKHE
jgi:hypothetical protein